MKHLVPRILITLLFLSSLTPVSGQDLRYIEYDTDLIPPSVHKDRREKIMEQIGPRAVAFFYSAPERNRNADVEFQYRQDDNLLYLTGFPEPQAILALVPGGVTVRNPDDTTATMTVKEILFVRSRNPLRETWDGRRYGPAGAMKLRGMAYAVSIEEFAGMLPRITGRGGLDAVYVPPFHSDLSGDIAEALQPLRAMIDRSQRRHSTVEFRDPNPMVFRMRAIKSPEEIALLAKATRISALAHNQAMMSCEPGMYEYELQAVYEYVFRKLGAEYGGYPCIVGAAENSVVLHYSGVRKKIRNGDIVLADCAAEYRGYSSDITRTFPANGKFSPAQRRIYEIVLAAQNEAIVMMKPGVEWRAVAVKVEEVIEDGLFRLGLVKEKNRREFRKFYLHGIGHPVGLNVHDISLPVLEPGMVYTIEPGIYVAEGIEGVPAEYTNIGVRIEDVVLITKEGNSILSSDSPREIAAIEALMKKKGVGNFPIAD
ncbi:MAG: aminopeptidase P N-terminal domain-containing protein [Bacteroidota bacterium]